MADTDCSTHSTAQNAGSQDPLAEALRTHFGFDSFRPGQADAISSLLQGEHTLVVMPTGSGKSLVYQMAAMLTDGVTLVISPLISLMHDQVRALAKRHIPAACINSTYSLQEQAARLRALADGRLKLVYVAPERLRTPAFREAVSKVKVSLLAVDEAHCISHWGHDFRPDYLNIASARAVMHNPVTAALTATATAQVRSDISRELGLHNPKEIVTGFNRPNLSFEVRFALNNQAKAQALVEVLSTIEDGSAIVYTGSRRDTEELAGLICHVTGQPAEFYHAGMDPDARTDVTNRFLSGELPIVTATNAFGMGIDRADVRMVVHFTLPGSLEAYYQEAGRAGRDGQDSQALLIYSPQDTSLHEHFIRSSALERDKLYAVYRMLSKPGSAAHWVDNAEISTRTGLAEVAVRVGLSLLEEARAIVVLAVDGKASQIEIGEWNEGSISAAITKSRQRLQVKRTQLQDVVRYAESSECRRRTILEYFGDASKPVANICCDNCITSRNVQPDASTPLPDGSKMALLILEAVQRLEWQVGRIKLAQILAGGKSKEIQEAGYTRNSFYGRLEGHPQSEVLDIIDQLLRRGYLAMEGSSLPVVKLSRKGESALTTRQTIEISIPHAPRSQNIRHPVKKMAPGSTYQVTAEMFSRGMTVQEIAVERVLLPDTIYNHLARCISTGELKLEQVLTADEINAIKSAMDSAGPDSGLAQIKSILGDAFGYGPISCVAAANRRHTQAKSVDSSEISLTQKVEEYLSSSHPRILPGTWDSGWSLGFHSTFSGADWNRSFVGDLVYRLKYREDREAVYELVRMAADICKKDSCIRSTEVIVPMPGSITRTFDHVSLFAKQLASKTNKQVLTALSKVRATHAQKELHTIAQKHRNVAGAIACDNSVRGKNILLVDDLYDSGATFAEAARVIMAAGAKSVCILALTSTIHSDA